ncbi:MAG: pantoate--beta-alanine ligase [Gemmatimonadetes bacterium]|nr:pantoate--beta-alanine ligase [Gemmatimonadota bacterium]
MLETGDPRVVRTWSRAARTGGRRVGFVPTMGFLHEGHLRLVDVAHSHANAVAMSIFVNPLQFGPTEDFARYLRDIPRDRTMALERGVECLFVPEGKDIYRREAVVRVSPGSLAGHLCGPFRPGHFEGVLTVVAKLFHIVEPDVAVFGRKDAQQAALVRRMVADLDFPVEIVVVPTVREADGLALSSRNAGLSADERRSALALSRGLDAAHEAFRRGERDGTAIVNAVAGVVRKEPAANVEYIEAVDPETLGPVAAVSEATLVALAVRVGKTRLIDNVILGQGLAGDERLGERG